MAIMLERLCFQIRCTEAERGNFTIPDSIHAVRDREIAPLGFRKDGFSFTTVPSVCVGPTSQIDWTLGKLNVSWDPLPCHLQNGANIRDCIIQCTMLPAGRPKIIYSSTDSNVECRQEPGCPHSCQTASSFFSPCVIYSFQVAAQNSFGVGSFSTPVHIMYSSQGKYSNYVLLLILLNPWLIDSN